MQCPNYLGVNQQLRCPESRGSDPRTSSPPKGLAQLMLVDRLLYEGTTRGFSKMFSKGRVQTVGCGRGPTLCAVLNDGLDQVLDPRRTRNVTVPPL